MLEKLLDEHHLKPEQEFGLQLYKSQLVESNISRDELIELVLEVYKQLKIKENVVAYLVMRALLE